MKILTSANWSGWGIEIHACSYLCGTAGRVRRDAVSNDVATILDFAYQHRESPAGFTRSSVGILLTDPPGEFAGEIPYRITFVNHQNRYRSLMLMMQELCSGQAIQYVQNYQNYEECFQHFVVTPTESPLQELDGAMNLMFECFGRGWRRIGSAIARG